MAEVSDPYYITWVAQLSGIPTGQPSITVIIAGIINLVLSVVGVVAVVVVIYAGYLWLTSLGNEEKIRKAKALLANGAIGLGIIFAAYLIARTVVMALAQATGV